MYNAGCTNHSKQLKTVKNVTELNPDNSNLQGKSKKVRVIKGKISKNMTWMGIQKRFELAGFNSTEYLSYRSEHCGATVT